MGPAEGDCRTGGWILEKGRDGWQNDWWEDGRRAGWLMDGKWVEWLRKAGQTTTAESTENKKWDGHEGLSSLEGISPTGREERQPHSSGLRVSRREQTSSLLYVCLTLCNFIDCNPPSSSVHGVLQAIMLEWVAMPFARGPLIWAKRRRNRESLLCMHVWHFTEASFSYHEMHRFSVFSSVTFEGKAEDEEVSPSLSSRMEAPERRWTGCSLTLTPTRSAQNSSWHRRGSWIG